MAWGGEKREKNVDLIMENKWKEGKKSNGTAKEIDENKVTRMRESRKREKKCWHKIESPVAIWRCCWNPFDSSQMEMSHCNITLPTDFYEIIYFFIRFHHFCARDTHSTHTAHTCTVSVENRQQYFYWKINQKQDEMKRYTILYYTNICEHQVITPQGMWWLLCTHVHIHVHILFLRMYGDQAVLPYNRMQSFTRMEWNLLFGSFCFAQWIWLNDS